MSGINVIGFVYLVYSFTGILTSSLSADPFVKNGRNPVECFNECFKLLTTCGQCAGDIYRCTTGQECFKMLSRPCFRCIGVATNQCLGCTYDSYECVEACKNKSQYVPSLDKKKFGLWF